MAGGVCTESESPGGERERVLLGEPHLLGAAGAGEAAGVRGRRPVAAPWAGGRGTFWRPFSALPGSLDSIPSASDSQRREARRKNFSRSCKSVMSERRQRACLFEIKCVGVTLVSTSFRCAAAQYEVCVLAAGSLGSFLHHVFDPLTPFVSPPPFPSADHRPVVCI